VSNGFVNRTSALSLSSNIEKKGRVNKPGWFLGETAPNTTCGPQKTIGADRAGIPVKDSRQESPVQMSGRCRTTFGTAQACPCGGFGNSRKGFFRQPLGKTAIREAIVKQSIVHIALVVRDYDEAIAFYTEKLHFTLIEDTYQPEQDKRWVVVSPPGSIGTTLLLGKASKPEQQPFIGNQAGGRVFLFLNTDDFWRDYNEMISKGINFVRAPKEESYGLVAVFEDLYGNLWDLLQINANHPLFERNS
jgi:catechol 2,3-dioxygenase-like lactoylglutathione lyase family enzyme